MRVPQHHMRQARRSARAERRRSASMRRWVSWLQRLYHGLYHARLWTIICAVYTGCITSRRDFYRQLGYRSGETNLSAKPRTFRAAGVNRRSPCFDGEGCYACTLSSAQLLAQLLAQLASTRQRIRGVFFGAWHAYGTYLATHRVAGRAREATTMPPQRDNSWRGATARLKEKQTRCPLISMFPDLNPAHTNDHGYRDANW